MYHLLLMTVVTEAKAQNHSRCSATVYSKNSCQARKETLIYNFKKFQKFFVLLSGVCIVCFGSSSESSSSFQLCFVTVFCSEGLKTKLSTHFSLDCNSFFLYRIFIGHNDIL